MSHIRNFAAPIILAGVIAVAASISVIDGSAAQQRAIPSQTLHTTNGATILVTFDARSRSANVFAASANGRTPLADGVYRTTNGGAIRVQGGRIVWDAFGAIGRMNSSGFAQFPDPIG